MESFTISKEYFSPKDTLECGQVFRYGINEKGNYYVFSKDKYAEIIESSDVYVIESNDKTYFENYFDINTDYSAIVSRLSANNSLISAINYGKGIRILRQELFEMIISFIISANNNIKRIKGIIERICTLLGEQTEYGFAFPTLEKLAQADKTFFASVGCGYRADYLSVTCKQLLGCDLSVLSDMSTPDIRKFLMQFKGVGGKVADCILLFGMYHLDVFPTDTWIKKVYHIYFEAGHSDNEISSYLVSLFGSDSGYVQQYLFNYLRQAGQSHFVD